MARGTIERTLRTLLWLAGVAAFIIVLARADVAGAWRAIAAVGPLLAFGLAPYLGQIALDALAWRTLLGALDHRVAWHRLIRIRLSTEAVLQSIPGGSLVGESLKPYLLNRVTGVAFSDTIASIGFKRCLLAFAQAGYLALALIAAHRLYGEVSAAVVGTESLAWYVGGAAIALALVATGLATTLLSVSIADRARRALARLPSNRLRAAIESRRAGFHATDAALATIGRHRGRLVASWLLLEAAWLVETGETYLLSRLVGLDLDVAGVLAMEAAVVFARNLAFFVPAGLGVQDAGYLAFLAAFGSAAPLAAAFIVVKRAKELVWIAIGYLVLLALDRRPPREPAASVGVVAPVGAELGGL